jgi:hypothetical protein
MLRQKAVSDKTSSVEPSNPPGGGKNEVSSVLSVSVPTWADQNTLWCEEELALLAETNPNLTPADLPLVQQIKEVFQPAGATLISLTTDEQSAAPDDHLRRLLAIVESFDHRHGTDHRATLHDAWNERIAICTVDGNLPPEKAGEIALTEIKANLPCRLQTG